MGSLASPVVIVALDTTAICGSEHASRTRTQTTVLLADLMEAIITPAAKLGDLLEQ